MNWALARVFWLNRLPEAPIHPGKVVGSSARHGLALPPAPPLRVAGPNPPTPGNSPPCSTRKRQVAHSIIAMLAVQMTTASDYAAGSSAARGGSDQSMRALPRRCR